MLLIDQIDKTDQEFEAMLLSLSDFRFRSCSAHRGPHPRRAADGNNQRAHRGLKRRCLYLWLDYPDLEHELEIVRLHPRAGEGRSRKLSRSS